MNSPTIAPRRRRPGRKPSALTLKIAAMIEEIVEERAVALFQEAVFDYTTKELVKWFPASKGATKPRSA